MTVVDSVRAAAAVPPLRWAVVGIGRHSRQFVVPAIAAASGAQLAAIVSRDPDGARRFAEPFGSPAVHSRYEDALADSDIDAVFLVTPNDLHREQVVAAARAGKHVLCEKPLAVSSGDARIMAEACREAGVALGTGFHLRHNDVHRRARRYIAEGRIGAVRFVDVRYAHRTFRAPALSTARAVLPPVAAWRRDPAKSGGGAFVSTGSHAIDLVRFLTGSEFVDVSGRADAAVGSELNLVVAAGLSNGAIATLHAGDLAFPANETVISGTDGTIVCRGSVGNTGTGTLFLETAEGRTDWSPTEHDVYVNEVESFARAVRTAKTPDASGIDGLRCLEVVEAVYASAVSNAAAPVKHQI